MGCIPKMSLNQRVGQPSETEDEVVLDEHHSEHSLIEEGSALEYSGERRVGNSELPKPVDTNSQRRRVEWPATADKKAWQQFDDDVEQMLESVAKGLVDHKKESMATLIYAVGAEQFGSRERKTKDMEAQQNRRIREIARILQDLRRLTRRYRESSEQEKAGLQELRGNLRERLKTLRRAENSRRKREDNTACSVYFKSLPVYVKTSWQQDIRDAG